MDDGFGECDCKLLFSQTINVRDSARLVYSSKT